MAAGIERTSKAYNWMGEFQTNHPTFSSAVRFSFPLFTGGIFGLADLMMSYWVIRGSLAVSAPLGIVAGMLVASAISSKVKLVSGGAARVRVLESKNESLAAERDMLRDDLKSAKDKLAEGSNGKAGDHLGIQFIKVKKLGSGSQATVYLVVDRGVDQPRVLKVPALTTAIEYFGNNLTRFLEKFSFEARNLAKLNHKFIVTVFHQGEMDLDAYIKFTGEKISPAQLQGRKIPYILMEEVQGESLARKLDDEKEKGHMGFPIPYAAGKLKALMEALEEMKSKGVTHRDVKTENIISTKDGIKLLDFGIARDVAGTGTQMGEVMGSPGFIAPEQMGTQAQMYQSQVMKVKDLVKVDWYSDLYSAGAVFWEMMTGEILDQDVANPLNSLKKPVPDIRAKLREHHDRLTLDLDILAERIDRKDNSIEQFKMEMQVLQKGMLARLQKIFNRTLEIDPRKRYQDYAELQQDLDWIIENFNTYSQGVNQLLSLSTTDFAETAVKKVL